MPPFTIGITTPSTKQLDDSFIDERMELERRAIRNIRKGLQAQLDAIIAGLPPDADFEKLTTAQKERLINATSLLAQNDDDLKRAIAEINATASTLGVTASVSQMDAIGLGFDFALANESASVWARTATDALLASINTTSTNVVGGKVSAWIESGAPLGDLVKDLSTNFGRSRAELIASTEVTRAYAEGNRMAWQQTERDTGLTIGRQWRTANDERVCPICAPLGGLTMTGGTANDVSIDTQRRRGAEATLSGDFTHPDGTTYPAPPAHPRCRCWTVPVVVGVPDEVLTDE